MRKRTLATMYGVGLVRFAPGTAGSLVAALLAFPLLLVNGWMYLLLGALVLTVMGTISASSYMRAQNTHHDPSEIVVDEWAGQWLTYALFPAYSALIGETMPRAMMLGSTTQILVHVGAGFVTFRLFDILKPWPISWADRRVGGGFGVMFDDLLAAIPAAVLLFALDTYAMLILRDFV